MSAPSDPMADEADAAPTLWHYDGVSALRRTPSLDMAGDGFWLVDDDGRTGPFAWSALQARDGGGGDAVYGLADRPGWRIGFSGDIPAEIRDRLPAGGRYGRLIDRFGLAPATAAFAVVAAIAIFTLMKLPGLIAPFIPAEWESRMGDAMVGDFGGRLCDGPGGQEALDRLTARIAPHVRPIDVRVANIDMVNAVALPGGKIIIFRKLLDDARSPDEVAGVLGHEIGHVEHRDVVQALLRQTGLSVLMLGTGGDAGGYFNALVSATYSRDAESKADGFSIGALKAANISPRPTAAFFNRLAGEEKVLGKAATALSYVASHPLSQDRERRFAGSATAGQHYRPALSEADWTALKQICSADPDVAESSDWLSD
ncbi:M48 family metallopeptidase [Sphingomonas sp. SCN 67-18]|uniref:M48 family metallopeptidase n=1 Tax=uncultured Sphingomonas sp. TaxID=158754 RepID=UPI0025D1AC9B|nr:M48 family metallopeptidase [Sphingomonas sp. SCN 67-18]